MHDLPRLFGLAVIGLALPFVIGGCDWLAHYESDIRTASIGFAGALADDDDVDVSNADGELQANKARSWLIFTGDLPTKAPPDENPWAMITILDPNGLALDDEASPPGLQGADFNDAQEPHLEVSLCPPIPEDQQTAICTAPRATITRTGDLDFIIDVTPAATDAFVVDGTFTLHADPDDPHVEEVGHGF